MTVPKIILCYLLTTVAFFAVDMTWLGLIAKDLYQKYLGGLLSDHVHWGAAIIFYLLFIAGIFIFVIFPSIEKNSFLNAVLYGAIFGFIAYSTYDLTNYATMKEWPLTIVFIDLAWGSFLTSTVSAVGYYIVKMISSV
jgi:uncharacterized membrane protein